MTPAPSLERFFATLDSAEPSNVLSQVTNDFAWSALVSKGEGDLTEIVGDRTVLEDYLVRRVEFLSLREREPLVHRVLFGHATGVLEMVHGMTTRGGVFEAQFNATAQVDEATDHLRRLLICRTPELSFE